MEISVAFLREVLRGEGEIVVKPIELDHYGRVVADVFLGASWLNYWLVKKGCAWALPHGSEQLIAQAQLEAQRERLRHPGSVAPPPGTLKLAGPPAALAFSSEQLRQSPRKSPSCEEDRNTGQPDRGSAIGPDGLYPERYPARRNQGVSRAAQSRKAGRLHRHHRYQRTRSYGDYLYAQDREKFAVDLRDWLAERNLLGGETES